MCVCSEEKRGRGGVDVLGTSVGRGENDEADDASDADPHAVADADALNDLFGTPASRSSFFNEHTCWECLLVCRSTESIETNFVSCVTPVFGASRRSRTLSLASGDLLRWVRRLQYSGLILLTRRHKHVHEAQDGFKCFWLRSASGCLITWWVDSPKQLTKTLAWIIYRPLRSMRSNVSTAAARFFSGPCSTLILLVFVPNWVYEYSNRLYRSHYERVRADQLAHRLRCVAQADAFLHLAFSFAASDIAIIANLINND